MSLEHWLPIAVGVFLVSMMLYGHYRGFLRQCVSIGALVITILAVRFATPYVTSFLKENTQVRQAVAEMMVKASGLEEYQAEQQDTPAFQRIAIENLKLPQSMKDALIENNNSEVYNLLGVDHFIEYVSAYLAGILINAAAVSYTHLLRDTVVEPGGDSCLTIVFMDPMNYDMGKRPTVIGQLEQLVQEKYNRSIYFKTRLAGRGELLNTIYVTEEELESKIHMDITYED